MIAKCTLLKGPVYRFGKRGSRKRVGIGSGLRYHLVGVAFGTLFALAVMRKLSKQKSYYGKER